MKNEESLSVANPGYNGIDAVQKIGLALATIGLMVFVLASFGIMEESSNLILGLSLGSILIGSSIYALRMYLIKSAGIKNDGVHHNPLFNRGFFGWVLGIVLSGYFVLFYLYPEYLGLAAEGEFNSGLIGFFDPLSKFFTDQPASQWFVYGTFYTLAMLSLGVKFILKYRHSRYQVIRTVVVVSVQLFFAYLIPQILEGLHSGQAYFGKDIKNIWPLNYYFFEEWHLTNMVEGGNLGMFYLVLGIFMFLIFTPIITYYLGKRWYCSWICGCGGLAETAGEPFRHLSDKSLTSWKIERWMVHSVLVLVTVMTVASLYGYFSGSSEFLGLSIYTYFTKPYGLFIGAIFSGVIGVGFYPLMGSRVWCRFGCPMAAYIGIVQRFKSRFRITTNGGQCISCGNCSTYCEMGIDVRAYAQKGQNVVRASCVGCGICATVCPRGVLKLENGPEKGRIKSDKALLGNEDLDLLKQLK